MDFFHERHTTLEFVEELFHPSNNSSQFEIKLHFIFKSQRKHYIILNQGGQPQCYFQSFPFCNGIASAAMSAAGDSPSPPPVAEAVRQAVGGRLLDGERAALAELAREQVSQRFPAAGLLRLLFEVCVEQRHVDAFSVGGRRRVVPAADVAFEQLEEYEVGCARADVDADVDIEELGDGRKAARMPCKHVFHGGCIN